MREPCIGCCMKHLGSASVLEHEINNGYPHHGPYMWGELVQASQEIEGVNREFASVIRDHRVAAQYRSGHSIPWDALIEFAYALLTCEDDAEAQSLRVPDKCRCGLELPDDTRRLTPIDVASDKEGKNADAV